MADFLTAVKSVRKNGGAASEAFLTEVSTQQQQQTTLDDNFAANTEDGDSPTQEDAVTIQSPEAALQALRSAPNRTTLTDILTRLLQRDGFSTSFDIRIPGPLQAQIINTLIRSIIPTFWSTSDPAARNVLVTCLNNVAGTSAVIARIRLLASASTENRVSAASNVHELSDLISVARALVRDDDFCFNIWRSLSPGFQNYARAVSAFKEFVSLIASGKVIATIARAEDVLKTNDRHVKTTWLSNGTEYAAWLGRNAATPLNKCIEGRPPHAGTHGVGAQILTRGFGLGYPLILVKGFWTSFLRHSASTETKEKTLRGLLRQMQPFMKLSFLDNTLRWLSTLADDAVVTELHTVEGRARVSILAALIKFLVEADSPKDVQPDSAMREHIRQRLRDPVLSSKVSFSVRRASVAALADRPLENLQPLLESIMSTFGDTLFIEHAPVIQQNSLAQVLLLVAGRLHRKASNALLTTARSSGHLKGVSNRLDSGNDRARWLGMIAATAVSELVDKAGSQMNFATSDMETAESKAYLRLVKLNDSVGELEGFELLLISNPVKKTKAPQRTQELPVINGKQTFGPVRPPGPSQTEVIGEKITEILDGEEDDDDDDDDELRPYAKPDSDPEDSDEDATLVNRKKSRAPVYIRDLMRMLKDDKDHDRFQLGIQYAAVLIRRKSSFGGEVKDHAEELALILSDLQDPFDTEDFDELKLQALIAVILSDVHNIAPWMSKQLFAGDYSLAQRCIMLSALGLSGRELAGFKQDDLNPLPARDNAFPSKHLPSRMHTIYSPADNSVKRLEAASKAVENHFIQPMALMAADEMTTHLNAVKVRTFSSRVDVERTKRKPAPNELARSFGTEYFFPLVSRYQQDIAAYGSGSVFASAPLVLVTFLKTLALLLHASGPATLDLPEITTAFWDLASSVRVQAVADKSVMEAVLFSLLTLLEVNDGAAQRLAQENSKQLMETQQWVEMVFERGGGGTLVTEGNDEESRIQTLSAGVLVKIRSVVEAYQKLLTGA